MIPENVMRLKYDSTFDVLYCTVGDASNSYGDESFPDIIIMKDMDTEEVTGYTVMNFSKVMAEKGSEYEFLSNALDLAAIVKKVDSGMR